MKPPPRRQAGVCAPEAVLFAFTANWPIVKNMRQTANIVVIGGGSWGAALAHQLRRNKQLNCKILVRSAQTASDLARGHIRQLPAISDLPAFTVTDEAACLAEADFIYLVLPVAAHTDSLAQIQAYAPADTPVVLCAKGLVGDAEKGGLFLPEYAEARLDGRPTAVLTGPSFADEVLSDLPTALLAASRSQDVSAKVASHFRPAASGCIRAQIPSGQPWAER